MVENITKKGSVFLKDTMKLYSFGLSTSLKLLENKNILLNTVYILH